MTDFLVQLNYSGGPDVGIQQDTLEEDWPTKYYRERIHNTILVLISTTYSMGRDNNTILALVSFNHTSGRSNIIKDNTTWRCDIIETLIKIKIALKKKKSRKVNSEKQTNIDTIVNNFTTLIALYYWTTL